MCAIIEEQVQPPIRAVKMPLFPTLESLQSVIDLAYSQMPVKDSNAMIGLLMTYHNTLLEVMERETNYVPRK